MENRNMRRSIALLGLAIWSVVGWSTSPASEVQGTYLETRTCQVYTGPCFANGESGLAGKEAIMAWNIQSGDYQGVDLSGLNVVLVVNASQTLGFRGLEEGGAMRSLIIVDDTATTPQREALVEFARQHGGKAGQAAVKVEAQPITMSLDIGELKGNLEAGDRVTVSTRKARPGDCICGNESAYYPPLAELKNYVAGISLENEFRGGLNRRWSAPGSRSAYMGLFAY
jgi:hypothetical protein